MNTVAIEKKEKDSGWSYLILPIYLLLCVLVLPYFRQIIDPDDTAYLKIAERWASGDFTHAINGMWSPLNPVIGAVFAKTGVPFLMLFKYLNMAFGCIVFLGTISLLRKTSLPVAWHFPALVGLLPFALYATYNELCADWLQCAILLLYLNLTFSKNFKNNIGYALLSGFLGALAYYAKYYNFHFFWLHFSIVCFFSFYNFEARKLDKDFWKWMAAGIGVLLLTSLPWILMLHHKYGFWGLNYTGKIDLAWSLDISTRYPAGQTLLPPTQPGAASFWEDPIWVQQVYVTPFSSFRLFLRQIAISGASVGSFVEVFYKFSTFALALWMWAFLSFIRGGFRENTFYRSAMLTTFCMPAGYFLFHFEDRFLWPLCILTYLLGLVLLHHRVLRLIKQKSLRAGIFLVFIGSFMLWPFKELYRFIQRNDDVEKLVYQLQPLQLDGSTFITNGDQNKLMRVAYLSRTSLLTYSVATVQVDALMDDVIKNKVNYYFAFDDGRKLFPDQVMEQLTEVTLGRVPGLRIFRLQ